MRDAKTTSLSRFGELALRALPMIAGRAEPLHYLGRASENAALTKYDPAPGSINRRDSDRGGDGMGVALFDASPAPPGVDLQSRRIPGIFIDDTWLAIGSSGRTSITRVPAWSIVSVCCLTG